MSPRTPNTLLLGGILLLAFAVRVTDLNGPSLFVDEFSEITLAKTPVGEIIWANDSAPPLFPLALKTWLTVFQTDASARWFSVTCGVASILCLYAIGSSLVNNATGLAAAFVLALMPMHVYYSQFVRCYSLMFLLAALDLWLLLRAAHLNRARDWAAFAFVAILGTYTHYYFVIFLATSAVVALIANPRLRVSAKPYIAYAAVAVAMIPFIWLLPGDMEFQKSLRDPRPVGVPTLGYTYFSLFNGYTLGPSASELQTISSSQAIRAAAPWLAAVGLIILALGYEGVLRLKSDRSVFEVAVLAILPVAILAALSIGGGLNYNVRFVTWIMIAVALLLGAGIAAGWNRRHVQLATAAFVITSGIAFANRHWVDRYEHEDLRDAAQFIQAHGTPGDTVYVVSDYLSDLTRYYLGSGWQVVELPKPGSVNHIVQTEQDAQAAADATHSTSAKQSWILYSRAFHGDPHGLLLEKITRGENLNLATALPGVTVYRAGEQHIAAK
jgi:hypothetical protein